MGALLRADIGYLQLPYLSNTVGQEIITTDETFNYLPFLNLNGTNVHRFNRELTLGTANNTASVLLPSSTWTQGAPTFTNVEDTIKIIGASAYVPKMSINDPRVVANVIAAKAKEVARSWSKMLIVGDGTDPQFSGVKTILSGSRSEAVASIGSGSISLAKLDYLISKVDAGPATFLLCNTTQRANIMQAIRGAGSLPNFVQSPNLGSGATLLYNGIPILTNDWITTNTTVGGTVDATSCIYAIHASDMGGFTGFYNGSNIFDVSDPVEVTQSDMVEFKVVMRAGFSYMSSHAGYALSGLL